jgi:DNA-binding LacI/PurR family transcriptional regulator
VRDPKGRAEIDRQLGNVAAAGGVIVRLAPYPGGRPDVGYSNRLGLSLAVDHLVDLGHRAIAFLAGPPGIATSVDRLKAMRQAMKRHGLALAGASIFDGGFSRAGGERAAAEFVGAGLPATAIVAANDQAAIGFMRGLRERGVDVPGAVSVVGYDDIGPSALVEPPLTTVHVPLYDLGVRGMRLALHLLDGGSRSTPIELPLELTLRASTAPPAALQAGQQHVQTTDVRGERSS